MAAGGDATHVVCIVVSAACIAAVSSVTPSPLAPKSATFSQSERRTMFSVGSGGTGRLPLAARTAPSGSQAVLQSERMVHGPYLRAYGQWSRSRRRRR
jgi:hypothetical protein